jgi:putative membrane protein
MRVVRRLLWVALAALVLVVGWLFASHNGTPVAIDLIAMQMGEAPLWLGLVAAFGVGAVCAGLGAVYEVTRLGLLARRYRKAVVRLESEIHQLRNLPLAIEEGENQPLAVPEAARLAAGDG